MKQSHNSHESSDEYEERIIRTGYKRDWRQCKKEMDKFKECWKKNQKNQTEDQK
ncbi:hypothetical protein Glove_101g22 [Diversispora epigaea]|uniref:CHCH domain-containing protein n=1 Tax=Diversispora epigaea TaxID=1348612 RepID=A0A397J4H6_9GLOM|nr:hypothetical protein Glove_101g22 [Diversispora epigaea]